MGLESGLGLGLGLGLESGLGLGLGLGLADLPLDPDESLGHVGDARGLQRLDRAAVGVDEVLVDLGRGRGKVRVGVRGRVWGWG